MEELMQKLSGYLDAAAGVITEYAPQAVDAALAVLRLDAIWHLIIGGAMIFACWRLIALSTRWAKIVGEIEKEKGERYHRNEEVTYFTGALFFGIASAVFGVWGMVYVLTPYYWIAAIDPMLGLVYKAAQSAGLL